MERPLDDADNDNSCAITYYEIGHQCEDLYQKVKQKLIIHFLNEPFYNELRTKQQLGYVVFTKGIEIRDVLGF